MTTSEPGPSEVFTQGADFRPFATALRASRPAPNITAGFEVFVHEVIAAMMTAPSGIVPSLGIDHGFVIHANTQGPGNEIYLDAVAQANIVVGPYLAEAKRGDDGRPEPTHFREAFRRRGPSNYFHGKQADLEASNV